MRFFGLEITRRKAAAGAFAVARGLVSATAWVLLLGAVGAALVIAGIAMLAGAGWALIAGGGFSFALALLISRGLNNGR